VRRLTPILAILLLAAVVRIIGAGHWPVWTDEGWSTWAASDHNLGVILGRVALDRHPPLYFLTLSAWWTLAGYSRIALRFVGIASGLIGIAATYRIGLDWFGRRAAIYAALLLSLLDVAIYYSQEIRHYGWLMLAVALMTLYFLRYLRKPRASLLILYTLSLVFMLYSLYIGVLVLAVQGVVGLFIWRGSWRDKRNLVLAWLAALILYIPWLVVISRQLGILEGGIDGLPTNWDSLVTMAGILFGGQIALSVGLYLLGLWHIAAQPDRGRKSIVWLAQVTIALSGLGLFVFMFIANLRIGMISARTMVYMTPLLMLICGYGLSLLQRREQGILALALVVVSLSTTDFVQPRLNSNTAGEALAADYTPGDLIILENGWDDNAVRYEVMLAIPNGESADIIRTLPWVDNRDQNLPVLPQVDGEIQAHRRVWIVNWYQPSQVIPFLDQGGDGFVRVLSRETATGDQYKSLYKDLLMREVLFERPQDRGNAYGFGGLLALHDWLIAPQVPQGATLHVDLWWSAIQQLSLDYSASVFLQDQSGKIVAQNDAAPGAQPTTQWLPGILKFDRHNMMIPADLPPGVYKVGIDAYWYGDNKQLPVSAASGSVTSSTIAFVGDVLVTAK
jgi:Dolichyl-phosphate-mannose-protein mannosyltransferase